MNNRQSNKEYQRDMDARITDALGYGSYVVVKTPHVAGDNHSAHSVGMTEFGLPELIAVGYLHPNAMQQMLDGIISKWAGIAPDQRDTIQLEGILEGAIALEDGTPTRVKLVEVDAKNLGVYRPQALRRRYSNLGKHYRVIQVLWPDKAGVLPDEEDYDTEILQPLLPVKV